MRRRRSRLLCVAASVSTVTFVLWPLANYKWTLYAVTPYNRATGADPVFVSAPVADLAAPISEHTWRLCLALPEAVLGSLGAIGLFVLLGKWLGAGERPETVCRRCRRILRGLTEPQCPVCGQPL